MRAGRNGNRTGIFLLAGGALCAGAFYVGRARRGPAPEPAATATAPAPAASGEARPQVEEVPNPAASALTGPIVAPSAEPQGAPGKPFADAEAALATDEVQGLLAFRKLAVEQPKSDDGKRAQARLVELAAAAREEAKKVQGDAFAERNALSRAFLATVAKKDRKPLEARLAELNATLVLSNRPTPDGEVVTVKSGDRLITIARSKKTTWTLLKRVNGLKGDAIRIGQKLKVPTAPVSVLVLKDDFQLVLLIGGHVLKAFDVGTGREDRTPEGTFTISERLTEPTWYAPDGKVHPFGTKENILGTRWLGFSRTEQCTGFGIHGTAFPETIGTPSSAGCIRMRNEEVEEVYDFVAEGATVQIQR